MDNLVGGLLLARDLASASASETGAWYESRGRRCTRASSPRSLQRAKQWR